MTKAALKIDHGPERVLVIQPGYGFGQSRKSLYYVKTAYETLSWNAMIQVFAVELWIVLTIATCLMIFILPWNGKTYGLHNLIFAITAMTMALLGQSFDHEIFLKVPYSSKSLIRG